eukprot:scaffold83753_cov72-Phaeocystis_antarctica.AAC.5
MRCCVCVAAEAHPYAQTARAAAPSHAPDRWRRRGPRARCQRARRGWPDRRAPRSRECPRCGSAGRRPRSAWSTMLLHQATRSPCSLFWPTRSQPGRFSSSRQRGALRNFAPLNEQCICLNCNSPPARVPPLSRQRPVLGEEAAFLAVLGAALERLSRVPLAVHLMDQRLPILRERDLGLVLAQQAFADLVAELRQQRCAVAAEAELAERDEDAGDPLESLDVIVRACQPPGALVDEAHAQEGEHQLERAQEAPLRVGVPANPGRAALRQRPLYPPVLSLEGLVFAGPLVVECVNEERIGRALRDVLVEEDVLILPSEALRHRGGEASQLQAQVSETTSTVCRLVVADVKGCTPTPLPLSIDEARLCRRLGCRRCRLQAIKAHREVEAHPDHKEAQNRKAQQFQITEGLQLTRTAATYVRTIGVDSGRAGPKPSSGRTAGCRCKRDRSARPPPRRRAHWSALR